MAEGADFSKAGGGVLCACVSGDGVTGGDAVVMGAIGDAATNVFFRLDFCKTHKNCKLNRCT